MSNTYTWSVTKLESFASINGLENAVGRVYWNLSGTDNVNTVEVNGTVDLDLPDTEAFIAYSSLTQEQVIEWTKAKLGSKLENEYYQYLDQKLSEIARPEATETPMPWMPSE
jgi:hypothetical protein